MDGLTYLGAGVDAAGAARETGALARVLAATAGFRGGAGEPMLKSGYYASAVRLTDDLALGICTDGVGSKILVAEQMGKFDTIGVDCIAMNVNDLVCIGCEPLCLVDYIGVDRLEPGRLEAVARGLAEGARQARISIPGGETAQLPGIISGLDLVGTAVGVAPVARISCGRDVAPGDVVVGLSSSGVHSNGLTLARKAILERGGLDVGSHVDELGRSAGEALLEPTRIYVKEAMALFEAGLEIKALCHITGDGLLNLNRVAAPVGFVLDALPPPHPIFNLIQRLGGVETAEMYTVFNMGIGMCAVLGPDDADRACEIAGGIVIGRAVEGPLKSVGLPQPGLIGSGTAFAPA